MSSRAGEAEMALALQEAALRLVGGEPTTALARLGAALATDDALFTRLAEDLARASPFDALFVARVLASLHLATATRARRSHARLLAKNRALAQSARRDPLTRIWNRAALEDALAIELRRARRYETPFSVLFIDVDRFKRINDTWGHAAGDRVLQGVVCTIACALRPGDVLGRYGGEELVVGLVEADLDAATRSAERLRRDIEAASFVFGNAEVHVTVSLGVASASPDASVREIIGAADDAMLRAKSLGRNRVHIARRVAASADQSPNSSSQVLPFSSRRMSTVR